MALGKHPCRACSRPTAAHQSIEVRGKPADLHRCPTCGTFQFPDPTWLNEAYADPISELDVGLASRCMSIAGVTEAIVRAERLGGRPHLDYGGGYGLLTRLLRDRGIDMRHRDPFAKNLFAQGFDADLDGSYGCITAVEIFEHLTNPRSVLDSLAAHGDLVLVSTILVPDGVDDLRDWWYVVPELGQHVTFYSARGLDELARACGYELTTDGVGLHVLHRTRLHPLARLVIRKPRTAPAIARILRTRDRSVSYHDADSAAAQSAFADHERSSGSETPRSAG